MKSRIPASLRVIGRSIVDWWDGWLDMVLVTILWFLAQLTVVLGPPATFGLYYVVGQMVNGEALGVKGLIQGARQFFGKAWLWGALNLLAIVTLAVNFQFYGAVKATWGFYAQIIVGMIGFLYLATTFYGLAYYMALEQPSLRTAFKNGLLTTLAAPFFSIILMIFCLLVVALSGVLVIPIFLGLPALIPILGFRGMDDRLIAFGLREREKTPKEIEAENGGKILVQGKDLSAVENEPKEKPS